MFKFMWAIIETNGISVQYSNMNCISTLINIYLNKDKR